MKLDKKQKDMLWGGNGPYSQARLIKEVRILDDSVSRIFLVVEVSINPTTFEIVKEHRKDAEFADDMAIQQLLDHSDYRGPEFGYVSMAFEMEDDEMRAKFSADTALNYSKRSIIKMHKFVMNLIKL